MRIWMVNHYAAARHHEMALELQKAGHCVEIWRSNFRIRPGDFLGPKWRLVQTMKRDGITYRLVGTCSYRRNDYRRALNMLLFSIGLFLAGMVSKRPDVILGSSPHLPAAWVASRLARLRRVPFVAEIRDLWPETLIQMGGIRSKRVIAGLERMEKSLYRNSRAVIALTRYIAKRLQEKGLPCDKVHFLPNGIIPDQIPKQVPDPQWRREMGLENRFVCLYAGALGPANDLKTAVRAAGILQREGGYAMVIVGDGPERERLQALAAEAGVDNVFFVPWVPREEAFTYMMTADALLLPLLDVPVFGGAIPNKLLHYLACNRPIICAVRGEALEIVRSANAGVEVTPSDPEALTNCVRMLKENPQLCAEYSREGRALVEKEFNRLSIAARLKDLLVRVCSESNSSGA